MKILSIGNSFSEDSQRYLHRIAAADGLDLYTVNLCIGGCSLESHYNNFKEDRRNYVFQENGVITERLITLKEGLSLEDWDVVTVQQVSTHSFIEDSYYPYICELAGFIRQLTPKAKLVIHNTWAYEDGCDRMQEVRGDRSFANMRADINRAYKRAKKEISADGIIQSGDLFALMIESGANKMYRDTFHASLGLGRYALGLLWYRSLTGNSVLNNSFADFDEPISQEEILIAKKCAEQFGKTI